MYKEIIYSVFIAILIFNVADARKFRRNKRPKPEEDSTPQPSVVSYSTFGFNDVGSYDGFVPSSPDYVNQLNSYNQEPSTRLYAPAFPTAMDNQPSESQNGQTFGFESDDLPQASILQSPYSSMSFSNTPSLDFEDQGHKSEPEIYGRNGGDLSAPIYGTKLSSKHRNKQLSNFNNTDFSIFSSASSPSDNKYSTFHEVQSAYESKPTSFGEPHKSFQYNYNYATTHPTTGNEEYIKSPPSNAQSSLKFPKVVDFTNLKQYYPTELSTTTTETPNTYLPETNVQKENSYFKNFDEFKTKYPNHASFKDPFKEKEVQDATEKEKSKHISYSGSENTQNYLNSPYENSFKDNKFNNEYKDNFKYNSWATTNHTNDFKTWKNPIKGYQYSTNFSNMNFEFDFSGAKKPVNNNNDELVPASSNTVDWNSKPFSDTDYSRFKKIPSFKGHENEDYGVSFDSIKGLKPQGYKYDPEEYIRSIYNTVPPTTSIWDNFYKNPEFSSYKNYGKKPQFSEDIGDDIVHIPKRPYSNKYAFGSKPTEWSSFTSHRQHKPKKPNSWNKDVSTRFKSEEDLLGLRTHDTSQPSYLPSYKPETNSFSGDEDYKKLVEKWRQSYLRAKYKDVGLHDFESYASETKPLHVPIPKPYAIEVPNPVIVPVPQPYPVKVPIPRPVAVPVVHEITVPVEKPVPYPVYKRVPYPVAKHVPVPVEKEVRVPVERPFPVPVPYIRPVFHHTRPRVEADAGEEEEDDYRPRPDTANKISHAKRPRSTTRGRPRRPGRTYADRNRRRWPARRPRPAAPPRRPVPSYYKQYEHEFDDFEHSHSDYILHCKTTGNC